MWDFLGENVVPAEQTCSFRCWAGCVDAGVPCPAWDSAEVPRGDGCRGGREVSFQTKFVFGEFSWELPCVQPERAWGLSALWECRLP